MVVSMLNFNSVRVLFPESLCKAKVKTAPQEREATKISKVRQQRILRMVKYKPLGVSALVKIIGCKREQVRYDIVTMLTRGDLINLNSGKSPYLVKAA